MALPDQRSGAQSLNRIQDLGVCHCLGRLVSDLGRPRHRDSKPVDSRIPHVSQDGRKGTLQIITYGLLCASDGCPVAIEVFDGNTADPMTLAAQVEKLKRRFHLDHVSWSATA